MKWVHLTKYTVLPLLAMVGLASGQDPALSRPCDASTTGVGTVRGQLVSAEAARQQRRAVFLRRDSTGLRCVAHADSTGVFEFRGVPIGRYQVAMGSLGIRRVAPLEVVVEGSTPVWLAIPLRAVDEIGECLEVDDCASVLARLTYAEVTADPAAALRFAAYRLAIGVTMRHWPSSPETVVCVPATVVELLLEAYPFVAPEAECTVERIADDPHGLDSRLRHPGSDRDAVRVRVDNIQRPLDLEAVISLSYYVAGLWGGGYRCTASYRHNMWVPIECVMTWIS